MAARGQKATPIETRVAMGNPGKRPIPKSLAFSPGDGLAPPKRWPKKGWEREEWQRIVPEYLKAGIAKAVHQGALEKICELYAASVKLYEDKDYTGARMQAEAYRKSLTEFGGTPSSAVRVGGSGTHEDEDPADEFFHGPRLAK
jgi:hypothetical protein